MLLSGCSQRKWSNWMGRLHVFAGDSRRKCCVHHGATHIQFSRTCRSLLRSGSATLVWHHVFHPWSTLNWMRPCPCCSLFLASVLRQLQPKRYRNTRWLWFATLQDSFLFQKLVQCIIHVSHGFRNDRLVWNQRIHDVPKHSVSRQVLKFNECYDSWQQLATFKVQQGPYYWSAILVSASWWHDYPLVI
jgi:hypothetical protein